METEDLLREPLGVVATNQDHLNFLDAKLSDTDIIGVGPSQMDLLEGIEARKTLLLLTAKDYDNAAAYIAEAKAKGVEFIGYNLETPYSVEKMVTLQKIVYDITKHHGLTYVFEPSLLNLERHYRHFVPNTDIILLQAQHYQTRENYTEQVAALISKMKRVDPDIEVWVQLSVNPPEKMDISAEEVADDIEDISDIAGCVWIFYYEPRWDAVQEVVAILR